MSSHGFTLFETAIGWCGIVWGPGGLIASYLPESDPQQLRSRLRRRFPDAIEPEALPPDVQHAIDGIVAMLRGETSDLDSVALDMTAVPEFDRRVYEVARTISPGKTMTYGE